jgi:hypothetical protein
MRASLREFSCFEHAKICGKTEKRKEDRQNYSWEDARLPPLTDPAFFWEK